MLISNILDYNLLKFKYQIMTICHNNSIGIKIDINNLIKKNN